MRKGKGKTNNNDEEIANELRRADGGVLEKQGDYETIYLNGCRRAIGVHYQVSEDLNPTDVKLSEIISFPLSLLHSYISYYRFLFPLDN